MTNSDAIALRKRGGRFYEVGIAPGNSPRHDEAAIIMFNVRFEIAKNEKLVVHSRPSRLALAIMIADAPDWIDRRIRTIAESAHPTWQCVARYWGSELGITGS